MTINTSKINQYFCLNVQFFEKILLIILFVNNKILILSYSGDIIARRACYGSKSID